MDENYTELIRQGWCPTWTGLSGLQGDEGVLVRMGKGHRRIWCRTSVPAINDSEYRHLVKHTAERPGSQVCVYPLHGSQSSVRLVSAAGIGPYSYPGFGIGTRMEAPSLTRIVGLDIEQSIMYRGGNFPLHHNPIVSVC